MPELEEQRGHNGLLAIDAIVAPASAASQCLYAGEGFAAVDGEFLIE